MSPTPKPVGNGDCVGCPTLDSVAAALMELRFPQELDELVQSGEIESMFDPESGDPSSELIRLVGQMSIAQVNGSLVDMVRGPDPEFTRATIEDHLRANAQFMLTPIALAVGGRMAPDFETSTNDFEGRQIDICMRFKRCEGCGEETRVVATIHDMTEHNRDVRNLIAHREQLESNIARDRERLNRVERTLLASSELILEIASMRDRQTAQRTRAVADAAESIGRHLGIDRETASALRMATLVFDVGRLAVPVEILRSQAPLEGAMRALYEDHVRVSIGIVTEAGYSDAVRQIVAQHHEHWDGSGYPLGISGEEICVGARIICAAERIVDLRCGAFGAPTCSEFEVSEMIRGESGSWLSPDVSEAALAALSEEPTS